MSLERSMKGAAALRALLRKLIFDDRGQAAMVAGLALPAIVGVMSLAIDVGNLHFQQQRLQTVADAAAIAGALEISTCGSTANCSAMQTAAQTAVTENGFASPTVVVNCQSSSAGGVIIQVNNGPCALGSSDPNNGNAQYVEVVISLMQNSFFGAVLGHQQIKVSARAEATNTGSGAGCSGCCLYANSIAFNSSGYLNMTCGIMDNGNLQTNNGDKVTTPVFKVAGSWSPNNCNGSCTWTNASPQTGAAHQSDPLASLTPPTQPATSSTNNQTPSNGATLLPGYYPNGFNLNSNVAVNLSPGLYYMNGSINVNSGASLTCSACVAGQGVTLYFNSGTLQMNSGSTVNLTAPTSGSYPGMLLWQSSSNSTGMNVDAGSTSYLQGIIYLPDATLTLNSSSGVTVNSGAAYTAIDVNALMINSSETFDINNNYSSLPGGTSPFNLGGNSNVALAE